MNTRKWLYLVGIVTLIASVAGTLARSGPPALAAGLASTANSAWVIDTVQASPDANYSGARSLALDGYGHPHIVFGGYHLYYAYYNGTAWQVDLVDPAVNVGSYASLALDAAGHPHIGYADSGNGDLKYAYYDGTAWRIERVDSDGWVGASLSLALDPAGRPQITYADQTNQTIKIAWHNDTGWHNGVLDSTGSPNSALVLDANGYPHVAYPGGGLKYAHVTDGVHWQYEVVDSDPQAGGAVSLALDSQGHPHLSYCRLSEWGYCNSLSYAYFDGSAWQIQAANPGGWGGEYNSLALDRSDRPHISYTSGGQLQHAYYDGANWQVETVAASGYYTSLALDPSGRPHISYYNLDAGLLQYASAVPPTFADSAFEALWQRTDRPVAEGRVARSWMWGDRPLTAATFEPYADAPGGSRLVQYFDKSRMEINNPNGDRSSPWFVTNGLLVREMVEGWVQVGDYAFESHTPAGETVAGDAVAGNPNCPLYASFAGHTAWAADRSGQKVSATMARDGTVGDDPSKAAYPGTEIAHYEPTTGHNVPAVLWNFMNQQGLIYVGGRYRSGLVVDWLFAMGYPISEPYWTRCTVAGVEQDVLVQLFERRVLTYTPSNPAGWQVEMGNVGRHYYTWRYGVAPQP